MNYGTSDGSSHFVTGLYPTSTPLFGVLPHKSAPQNYPMSKKADGKPRGRMSAYAYFVQTCREEHKKKHPNESVVFAEFSKKCAERWKTMSEKEKKRFQDMAEKDKKRYEIEMSTYQPLKGDGKGGKGKKRKRQKDPNAPKRSLSAFFWFCQDERGKVKAVNPELTVGEIAKELGKRWNDVTEDTKSKYEALAAKDKARYEKEMKAYKGKKAKPVPPMKQMTMKKDDDDDDESGEEEEVEEDDDESGDDE